MQLASDGTIRLSPSDLANHLACPHLTTLELAVQRGELAKPQPDNPYGDLLRAKGEAHEQAVLARYEAEGRRVLRLPRYEDPGFDAEQALRRTEEAVRAGEADVIYQAHLADGPWRGFADFLERQPDGTYEPVDAKLARSAKPGHVLQLCVYAAALERIQGRLPERAHVELGTGERQSFRTADVAAFFRRARERLLAALAAGADAGTYPWPCEHCPLCDFRRVCRARLEADDHPVLVAGLGRRHAERLLAAGVPTLTALGQRRDGLEVPGIRAETLERLRHQAELQLHLARTGERRVDPLPVEEGKGFRILPAPSPGDVWLDLEGHPFYEPARGLEYLFGWCYREDGELRYEAAWGADRAGERAAFERFVDWVEARRRRHPDLHVYHYAGYEKAALRRLMGEHSTREAEIDDWLRRGLLVDLYRVVRQALRASVESYSLKEVEKLYGFARTADVSGGDESAVLFERWLELGEASLLERIRAYNEEDCRSLAALHRWLLAIRPPGLPWREPPEEAERRPEAEERDAELAALHARLCAGADPGSPRALLAHLLYYHRREAKSQWWEWFHHLELVGEELEEDTDTIGGLALAGEPVPDKRSLVYTFTFPPQEHKIEGRAVDPRTRRLYEVEVDDAQGLVRLRRGRARAREPLPEALIPPSPIPDTEQRKAVARVAESYLAGGGRHPALVEVLERRPPRARLDLPVPEAALSLDGSYLFVQGPPGSGKTWWGARAAVALMRAGRRVGVTSLSHKAIGKLLQEIEREAREQGFRFRGRKKSSADDPESRFQGAFVDSRDGWRDLLDPGLDLVAGTAWLFAREDFAGVCDTLIVDEAGQVALADVVAVGHAARNLVLLGDPNQLPQVSQGAQPEEAKRSVLQHLLGEERTVPPGRGVFLAETWRLRPELAAFTSEAWYEGRLRCAEPCARRTLAAGDGLVYRPVEHAGNGQLSWEEAEEVAAAIGALLGTAYTDERGRTRPLTEADVLVVAPYNAQVRALRRTLPAGVRVGTVDKFQGQEAPVVLVSLASSSGEEAPRGISFVFDAHRVNVATSRAQCRVELVCSPRLLEADCKTVQDMRLVNALCRFVELAERA
ncbi:MAG TPA: TM0106 family RecB-like putative nuclease [Gaiellaceae bacterium]|nr:TM0106 family RecB-like putative nuclease [Gaiellaceae bacterium]